MARRSAVELAAEQLSGLIVTAVEQTIAERSPEPARQRLGALLAPSRTQPEDEGRVTELMVTLILVRWLSVVREQLAERPERIEEVLDWVDGALGRRYRTRARYTATVLRDEDGAAEIMQYRKALLADFLPSLVWLLAGAVAVAAEGDVDWLRLLVGAPTPAA